MFKKSTQPSAVKPKIVFSKDAEIPPNFIIKMERDILGTFDQRVAGDNHLNVYYS